MVSDRSRDDHFAVLPGRNRLLDSPSGANRNLGRLDIVKRHKLCGFLGGHHGFVLLCALIERQVKKFGDALLDPVTLCSRLGHRAAVAIRRTSAAFSMSRVLAILIERTLASRISFVSFGCEIPSATQAAAGLSS